MWTPEARGKASDTYETMSPQAEYCFLRGRQSTQIVTVVDSIFILVRCIVTLNINNVFEARRPHSRFLFMFTLPDEKYGMTIYFYRVEAITGTINSVTNMCMEMMVPVFPRATLIQLQKSIVELGLYGNHFLSDREVSREPLPIIFFAVRRSSLY